MKKILVVEDDNTIHKIIKDILKKEYYIVISAYSGTEAISIIENDNIDLILLDLMLPGINGEDIVKRIKVQLRINSKQNKSLKYKDIELLEDNKTMKIQNNKTILTKTEYTIMRELLLNSNKVVTKTRLLDLISMDLENCDESSLKVHISNIRKKIRKITQVEYIEAVWGIGFKIKE